MVDFTEAYPRNVHVEPESLPRRTEIDFSDCVWAKLETEYTNPSIASIVLTMSLGTAEITPPNFGGRIRIGLTRLKLRLNATGGEILYADNRWPALEPETSVLVEQTEEHRKRQEESSRSGIVAKLGAETAGGEIKSEINDNGLTETSLMKKYKIYAQVIRSGGSSTNSYLEFESIDGKRTISTNIACRCLGSMLIIEDRASVRWGFDFMNSDLKILNAQGWLTGRAGSDCGPKSSIILGLLRKAVAADLRNAIGLRSSV